MDLFGINRRIGDFQRLREIVNVLIKHGFGHVIQRLRLDETLPFGKKLFKNLDPEQSTLPGYDRFRRVLEELGPTFVKFGQLLSLRADVVPPDLAQELEALQDRVPPESWETIEQTLDRSLTREQRGVIRELDRDPLASASLAQVHRARLSEGRQAVVKIQRPEIEEKIERDLNLMKQLATLVERYIENAQRFNPTGLVREFETQIRQELNFLNEAINVHRFRKNFAERQDVKIPQVYWELSESDVLVLEWIEGRPIGEFFRGKENPPVPREELARRGAEILLEQIFEHGFFHGDPHPGNILITPEGRIAFVDFGMVGRLDQQLMDEFAQVVMAIERRDSLQIMKSLRRLDLVQSRVEGMEARRHILQLIDKYYDIPLRQVTSRDVFRDINQFLSRFDILFPPDFYILLKALLTVESVGERLDPDFEFSRVARPYLTELVGARRDFGRVAAMAPTVAFDFLRFIRDLPADIYDLFRQIKTGQLHVEFEHQGLQPLMEELRMNSNRISVSLILSSLIIGSSLLIVSNPGPKLAGYSILGLAGYLIAAFFGLLIAISILRSGRF